MRAPRAGGNGRWPTLNRFDVFLNINLLFLCKWRRAQNWKTLLLFWLLKKSFPFRILINWIVDSLETSWLLMHTVFFLKSNSSLRIDSSKVYMISNWETKSNEYICSVRHLQFGVAVTKFSSRRLPSERRNHFHISSRLQSHTVLSVNYSRTTRNIVYNISAWRFIFLARIFCFSLPNISVRSFSQGICTFFHSLLLIANCYFKMPW